MANKSKKHRWVFLIIAFIAVLTTIRLSWMFFLTTLDCKNSPAAVQGVLDLRGWEFNDKQTLQLKGEWEFYPSILGKTNKDFENREKTYLSIPTKWDGAFNDKESFRFGTYRLRILLDEKSKRLLGLRATELPNAYSVYVNGQKLGGKGIIASDKRKHEGNNSSYTATFHAEGNQIELIIPVSSSTQKGGMLKPIRLGSEKAIEYRNLLSIGLQLLLCLVILLHSVYALALYFIHGKSYKGLLYFSILLFCTFISVLSSDDRLLYKIFNVDYEWQVKIGYLSYIGVGAFLLLVIRRLFPTNNNNRSARYFIIYCMLYAGMVLIFPSVYIFATARVLLLAALVIPIILSANLVRQALVKREENIYLLLGCISVGINIVWSTAKGYFPTVEMLHYPVDLIVAMLCFTAFWFKRFSLITQDAERFANKLQEENRHKDEFLLNTSHELRNPLHGISAIAHSLLNDHQNPLQKEQKKRLSIMIHVIKRLSLMLNDLTDITRLKEKTIQLHRQNINIKSAAIGVMEIMKLMTKEKPVQLLVKVSDSFPAVFADENRVIQIIFNLVHNAVKNTDEGKIVISADIYEDKACIHIEDTGIGMSEEEMETIFEPYDQTFSSKKRDSGGFGLGLSISKQLVELHQGSLSVQSKPGQGSVFTFTLPLAIENVNTNLKDHTAPSILIETEQNMLKEGIAAESSKDRFKILIVDDDPINIDVLIAIFDERHYAIEGVSNPEKVLGILEKESYDLVISDIMMPQMSGYKLTRLIRERYSISELPVLLLTARTRPEDIVTGFHSGANDYVVKPVDPVELKTRVQALTTLKISTEERIRMEAAWLQSQIKPHFIFNTLNSIASLGLIDTDKMLELLEEFSLYLRLSFDFHNAEPVIPLEQELSLVRSYLYIEKTRFGDRLDIEWDLDRETGIMIPPLTLQPLVENAVIHGALPLKEGGKITIRIKDNASGTFISVIDNGKGMNQKEIELLFNQPSTERKTSVGMRNVDTRLKQLYGRGLHIESSPDNGTAVCFQIPMAKDEESE